MNFASKLTSLAFFLMAGQVYYAPVCHGRGASPGCPRRLAHGRPSRRKIHPPHLSHHGLSPHAETALRCVPEILTAKKLPRFQRVIRANAIHTPRLEIPPPALHRRPVNRATPAEMRATTVPLLHRAASLSVSHKLSNSSAHTISADGQRIAPTVSFRSA